MLTSHEGMTSNMVDNSHDFLSPMRFRSFSNFKNRSRDFFSTVFTPSISYAYGGA